MQFLTISSAKCATVWPENPTSPSVMGNITVRVVSQKLLEMESLAQIPSVGRLLSAKQWSWLWVERKGRATRHSLGSGLRWLPVHWCWVSWEMHVVIRFRNINWPLMLQTSVPSEASPACTVDSKLPTRLSVRNTGQSARTTQYHALTDVRLGQSNATS